MDARAYTPTVHDITTLKAEVLPLVSHSGQDDVTMWLEWALSSTQGIGMGLMGQRFGLPISKTDALKEKAAEAARAAAAEAAAAASANGGGSIASADLGIEGSIDTAAQGSVFKNLPEDSTIGKKDAYPAVKPGNRTPEAFMKEVRGRLIEVETVLSSTYDGSESKYKPVTKELRLLVNATLAKVNVFLRNKRDAELAIETVEEIAHDLCHRTQNPDPAYPAMAARFRLEIEECKVPPGQSDEANNKSLLELFGFAKKYLEASEKLSRDASSRTLKADALKKCVCYYSSLSSAPLVGLEKAPTEEGSMDILMCFSEEEIAEKEASGDFTWFRQFGKFRALQLQKRVKELKQL